VESFIHIRIYIDGKTYPARLYGDKIVSENVGISLHKSQIVRIRVNYFKRVIFLIGDSRNIAVDYSSHIIQWIDPLRTVRYFFTALLVILPPFVSLVFMGISFILPSLLISLFTGLLASYFFSILRQKTENTYFKLFALILFICLPVMYWYPFSVYFFAGTIGVLLVFFMLNYFFSETIKIHKYYLSLSWVLLVVFLNFWIFAGIKFWADYRIYSQAGSMLNISQKMDTLGFGDTLWEKPLDWNIFQYRFLYSFLNRRELLWQISPVPISARISNPENPDFGWIAVSNENPDIVLKKINVYLEIQKIILLAELLEKTSPVYYPGMRGSLLQSFIYYDMISRKNIEIHMLLVPANHNDQTGCIIIAFTLPRGTSLNYYLDLFKKGLKKIH